jgi:membrane protein implicated in regulation of membrane protease activity
MIHGAMLAFLAFGVMVVVSGMGQDHWRSLLLGVVVGGLLGLSLLRPMRRKLRDGKVHWTMRRPWDCLIFFTVFGALAAAVGVSAWVRDYDLAAGVVLCVFATAVAFFTIVWRWVRTEEHRQGKEIWLLGDGPVFREHE